MQLIDCVVASVIISLTALVAAEGEPFDYKKYMKEQRQGVLGHEIEYKN